MFSRKVQTLTGLCVFVYVLNGASIVSSHAKCSIQSVRLGCYRDRVVPSRPIPRLLFTDRDPTAPEYSGKFVDLLNWNSYLKKLRCRCATEAKAKGYNVFGLQWYGECWSGVDDVTSRHYASQGQSKACVSRDLSYCRVKDTECVGRDYTNFVYRIADSNTSASSLKSTVNSTSGISSRPCTKNKLPPLPKPKCAFKTVKQDPRASNSITSPPVKVYPNAYRLPSVRPSSLVTHYT
ncbi:uncharacterized protein LOC116618880 isoform X2 [Nematostella vectensis]|uniref:uncharacterized protein LOC116618880 isoform X2 n=1 Tax=Nematostella vectensis TaxID=45351 RepID=UPI002077491F|nr:uncharacterized protein LOC116618880 isoform X2 [Nematostella vectensis]